MRQRDNRFQTLVQRASLRERVYNEVLVVRQVRAQARRCLRALVRVGRAERLPRPRKHAQVVGVVAEGQEGLRLDTYRGRGRREATALVGAAPEEGEGAWRG